MIGRHPFAAVSAGILALLLLGTEATVLAAPDTWDNLTKVKSKRLDNVYLLPGADFRQFNKVMLDLTEVAFAKNWRRDYNRSTSTGDQITERELQEMIEEARTGARDVFAEALTEGGYVVVTEPGPDVLRLRTAVIDISVVAPEPMTAGRSRVYSSEAGDATLVVEVRDSETGAILGRAVDQRIVDGTSFQRRTSVSNRSDFRQLVRRWAKATVQGLNELRQLSR